MFQELPNHRVQALSREVPVLRVEHPELNASELLSPLRGCQKSFTVLTGRGRRQHALAC